MRRLIGLTGTTLLLLAGTADAKTAEYQGSFKGHPDSSITFYVKVDGRGTPKQIDTISYGYGSLRLPCTGGLEHPNDPTSYQDVKLRKAGKNYTFSDSEDEGPVTTRAIEGVVAGSGKKITGTIDHEMDFGTAVCAVKNLRFIAKPVD